MYTDIIHRISFLSTFSIFHPCISCCDWVGRTIFFPSVTLISLTRYITSCRLRFTLMLGNKKYETIEKAKYTPKHTHPPPQLLDSLSCKAETYTQVIVVHPPLCPPTPTSPNIFLYSSLSSLGGVVHSQLNTLDFQWVCKSLHYLKYCNSQSNKTKLCL